MLTIVAWDFLERVAQDRGGQEVVTPALARSILRACLCVSGHSGDSAFDYSTTYLIVDAEARLFDGLDLARECRVLRLTDPTVESKLNGAHRASPFAGVILASCTFRGPAASLARKVQEAWDVDLVAVSASPRPHSPPFGTINLDFRDVVPGLNNSHTVEPLYPRLTAVLTSRFSRPETDATSAAFSNVLRLTGFGSLSPTMLAETLPLLRNHLETGAHRSVMRHALRSHGLSRDQADRLVALVLAGFSTARMPSHLTSRSIRSAFVEGLRLQGALHGRTDLAAWKTWAAST